MGKTKEKKYKFPKSVCMTDKDEIEEAISNGSRGSLLFLGGFFAGIVLNIFNWEAGNFVDWTISFLTLLAGGIWIWIYINYRYFCLVYRIYGFENVVSIEEKESEYKSDIE